MHYCNFKLALPLILVSSISASMTLKSAPPPQYETNACAIFKEYPQWYHDAHRAEQKWGIPIGTQLAIIKQESHFKAESRPHAPHKTKTISTATGYSQALRKTWQFYLEDTNKFHADPKSFADSVDFIGWYADQAHHRLGIDKKNTRAIYLAYHEGISGYKNQGYLKRHRWVMNVADKVQRQARIYQSQLSVCSRQAS